MYEPILEMRKINVDCLEEKRIFVSYDKLVKIIDTASAKSI